MVFFHTITQWVRWANPGYGSLGWVGLGSPFLGLGLGWVSPFSTRVNPLDGLVLTGRFGLGDTYGPTLDRIEALGGHKSKLGTAALMWICHSERELRAEELCQALAVEIGSTDYNADDAPSIQTVLNCCQGLVVDEGSTVRLIHRSLLGYLVSHTSFFQSPHSTIAEACLSYLNSKQVMALSGTSAQGIQHPLFLEYSSLFWGTHLRKGFSDGGKALALKLFSSYERHISIRPLLEKVVGIDPVRSIVNFYKFTGLHFASIFGLVEVAMALIKMDGVDINRVDETGVRRSYGPPSMDMREWQSCYWNGKKSTPMGQTTTSERLSRGPPGMGMGQW